MQQHSLSMQHCRIAGRQNVHTASQATSSCWQFLAEQVAWAPAAAIRPAIAEDIFL